MSHDPLVFRMLAALTILVAAVSSAPLWALGGLSLGDLLADDAPVYAAAIWWVCLAPVPLGLALLATLRTPWPWVAVVVLNLVVLVAVSARVRHLVPGFIWVGVAFSVVIGVAAVVAAVLPKSGPAQHHQVDLRG